MVGYLRLLKAFLLCVFISILQSCSTSYVINNLKFEKYYLKDSGNKLIPKSELKYLENDLLKIILKEGTSEKIAGEHSSSIIMAFARIYHEIYEATENFIDNSDCIKFELCKIIRTMDYMEFLAFATLVYRKNSVNTHKINWKAAIREFYKGLSDKVSIKTDDQKKLNSLNISDNSLSTIRSKKSHYKNPEQIYSPEKTSVTPYFFEDRKSIDSLNFSKKSNESSFLKSKYTNNLSSTAESKKLSSKNSRIRTDPSQSLLQSKSLVDPKEFALKKNSSSKNSIINEFRLNVSKSDKNITGKKATEIVSTRPSEEIRGSKKSILSNTTDSSGKNACKTVYSKKDLRALFKQKKSTLATREKTSGLNLIGMIQLENGEILPLYKEKITQ